MTMSNIQTMVTLHTVSLTKADLMNFLDKMKDAPGSTRISFSVDRGDSPRESDALRLSGLVPADAPPSPTGRPDETL